MANNKTLLNVLVIEDIKIAQVVAFYLFKKLNCSVHILANAASALEQILKEHYDIIFIDLQLPDLNGLELARTIRSMERRWHHKPLIAVTANSFEGLKEETQQAGFDDYLIKPLTIESIRHILFKHLNKAKSNRLD